MREKVSVTLPHEMQEQIDEMRGLISRSRLFEVLIWLGLKKMDEEIVEKEMEEVPLEVKYGIYYAQMCQDKKLKSKCKHGKCMDCKCGDD